MTGKVLTLAEIEALMAAAERARDAYNALAAVDGAAADDSMQEWLEEFDLATIIALCKAAQREARLVEAMEGLEKKWRKKADQYAVHAETNNYEQCADELRQAREAAITGGE